MRQTARHLLLLFVVSQVIGMAVAAPPRRAPKKASQRLPELKTPEDKLRFLEMIRQSFPAIRSGRAARFTSEDLDEGLERYVARGTSTPFAPIVDDETFLRRVTLDVTGKVPPVATIKKFVADTSPDKREMVIDELLASEDYGRKWGRYWRSVIFYESSANRNTINPQALEDWFTEEFNNNSPWDRIVGELVSATPQRNSKVKPQENGWQQDYGPNNFVLACERKPELLASNTARIFMGISIGCAECHDHPFDNWKREQFHELAAFFSSGRYYMTDQYDPSEKTQMQSKFLLGETPPPDLKPGQRRVALAAYLIYNPDNYWFARAFVNRMWSELIGDGFYSVDSLGPDKEVMHQLLVNRLAATFRYANFDVKWLFRTILNSRAYQREIRTLQDDADLFTAVRPTRLRSYEVADNVERLVGGDKNLRRAIDREFDANPSVPQRDLEGSIQQALLLMNNGTLQSKMQKSPLRNQLLKLKDDRAVVREAFLGILARAPDDNEMGRYVAFLRNSKNRGEAVDDLLWVLLNSAEFITRR